VCIKLVLKKRLYYDARSEKHQNKHKGQTMCILLMHNSTCKHIGG